MDNILYLYFFDILLFATLIYACTRKDQNNTYVKMPDDYKFHPEIVTAEKMYNEIDP
tara:strand:+ start:129 stop:299 length:171 start_codon:yes stop_codon:yes gene_type:complete